MPDGIWKGYCQQLEKKRVSVLSGRHQIMGATQIGALIMTVLEHIQVMLVLLDHGFGAASKVGVISMLAAI